MICLLNRIFMGVITSDNMGYNKTDLLDRHRVCRIFTNQDRGSLNVNKVIRHGRELCSKSPE